MAQRVHAIRRTAIGRLSLDSDYETERTGNLYKLVCAKYRNSYLRRLGEYADGIAAMRALVQSAPRQNGQSSGSRGLDRLRAMTARVT